MKKLLFIGVLALLASFTAVNAQNTNSLGGSDMAPASFFGSVQGYLSTVNTNFDWSSNKLEAAVGGDYIAGANWANYIKLQYDFGKWDVEGNFRNLGIGGSIQSVEAGGGYALIEHYDTKVIGYLDGGFDFNRQSGLIEPGVEIRKKGTLNTFFEAGISWPVWFNGPKNMYPDIRIGTGFTY